MLISIIVTLLVVGLLLWVVDQIPLDPTIRRIIHVVIVVCVVIYLINLLAGGLPILRR